MFKKDLESGEKWFKLDGGTNKGNRSYSLISY